MCLGLQFTRCGNTDNQRTMKFTPGAVEDAPSYYVDHDNGKYNTQKCVILRNLGLEGDDIAMPASLNHLAKPTHILDLTNNDLVFFPDLHHRDDIETLLLSKNRLMVLDAALLPSKLRSLSLAFNGIENFDALNPLSHCPSTVRDLVLIGNPICHLSEYRQRILALVPSLEVLDFKLVSQAEKAQAVKDHVAVMKKIKEDNRQIHQRKKKALAAGVDGKNTFGRNTKSLTEAAKVTKPRDKTIEVMNTVVGKLTEEKKKKIREQLANASSMEELERLERLLTGGV